MSKAGWLMGWVLAAAASSSGVPADVERDDWALIRMDSTPVGHARTTVSVLADGHIATRHEQSLMLGEAETARVVLVVEEDADGHILALDERRLLADGELMRVHGTVQAGLLVVEVDGDRFEVPWDADVRGPAFWRTRRAELVAGSEVGSTLTETEFHLDAAVPVRTRLQVIDVEDGLLVLRASAAGLPDNGLTCWVEADGDIVRSTLVLPLGRRTTERCDLGAAAAAVPELVSSAMAVQIRDGVLRHGKLDLAVPAGFRWFDWSGWPPADPLAGPELEAWACAADGRRLTLTARRIEPAFRVADLAGALGDQTLLGVERQAGGRPAFIGKQGELGTWGLAVLVRPHLLVARVEGADDAAMNTLLELADVLEFPDAE